MSGQHYPALDPRDFTISNQPIFNTTDRQALVSALIPSDLDWYTTGEGWTYQQLADAVNQNRGLGTGVLDFGLTHIVYQQILYELQDKWHHYRRDQPPSGGEGPDTPVLPPRYESNRPPFDQASQGTNHWNRDEWRYYEKAALVKIVQSWSYMLGHKWDYVSREMTRRSTSRHWPMRRSYTPRDCASKYDKFRAENQA